MAQTEDDAGLARADPVADANAGNGRLDAPSETDRVAKGDAPANPERDPDGLGSESGPTTETEPQDQVEADGAGDRDEASVPDEGEAGSGDLGQTEADGPEGGGPDVGDPNEAGAGDLDEAEASGAAVTEGPVMSDDLVMASDPGVRDDRVVADGGGARRRTGAVRREQEVDRDRADFSAITAFLRRRGLIQPARPDGPPAVPPSWTPPLLVGQPAPPAAEPERPTRLLDRRTVRRYAFPVVIVGLIGIVAIRYHLPGVDWGDDFALYMRQAKGLAMGNVGEVVGNNRFAVENSGWSTFSPYSYPWGWPLLVAPLYALFGLDYGPVKLLEVAAFCIFLLSFYAIVRRRAGALGATVIVLLIGLSPSFIGATDTVLSDIPFLCFVGLSLWWLDRVQERGILEEPRYRLVILGLLVAYTFNVRREGISVLVAMIALHLTVIGGRVLRARTAKVLRDIDWRTVAVPYLTFAGAAVAFQLMLPSVLRPTAPGTGLSNIPFRFKWQQDVLAEHVGLKDFGLPIQLLGSQRAGHNALNLLLILAVMGLVARLLVGHREDVVLAAYLCSASLVVLTSPYQEGRYLFTITPLLVYFAYQALPTVAKIVAPPNRWQWLSRLAVASSAVAIAGLTLINVADVKHATDYRRLYHPEVNGPESPDAVQMFAAVKTLTRGDDVILFFRARAMTLYTDRLAIQGSNLDLLLPRSDWYVMVKGSSYSQTPLTDEEGAARGLTKSWENTTWVIWRVPHPAA